MAEFPPRGEVGHPARRRGETVRAGRRVPDDLRYFVSMQATDTKKSPEVYYNVMSFPTAVSVADALALPEADALGISDGLSLGQYDSDVLAGSCLDTASDKLFGESGNGLLTSL